MDSDTPPIIFKSGDNITLRYGSEAVLAAVVMASANGRSLAVAFDGWFDGLCGSMPLLYANGSWRSIVSQHVYEVGRPS